MAVQHFKLAFAFMPRVLLTLAVGAQPVRAGPPIFRDDGDRQDSWQVFTSEGVLLNLTTAPDPADGKPALRLEYDFRLGSGYAGIRRRVGAPLPSNYQLSFEAMSDLPDNNLETKLVSPDGLDVWWVNRRAMEFPRTWTTLSARRRHFEFAWGPSAGKPLRELGSVEIVVASAEGGKGTLWLRSIELRELEEVSASKPVRIDFHTGTSDLPRTGSDADPLALDGWSADPGSDDRSLEIHPVNPPEIAGLEIEWAAGGIPSELTLEYSDDRSTWRPIRRVTGAGARRQFISLGEFGPAWLRLTAAGTGIVRADRVAVIPVEYSSPTAFATYKAGRLARGMMPRGFVGEQTYWTVVGIAEGRDEALMGEDGAVEVGRGDFTIEPFLEIGSDLVTWNESAVTQSLMHRSLPIPSVTRTMGGLTLDVTSVAEGPADGGELFVQYRISNRSPTPARGALVLAVRPYQVNPPTQWLNLPGGTAPVRSVSWRGTTLTVNAGGKHPRSVVFPPGLDQRRLAAGDWGDCISAGGFELATDGREVTDPTGSASAAASYRFALEPGQSCAYWVTTPLTPGARPTVTASDLASEGPRRMELAVAAWRDRITPVKIQLPRAQRAIADTALSTIAYILINKDGPGIQPGSRNYERSWIRDGSLTSAALLAFGHAEEVRRFIEWYGARQFDSGAIPCVVDRRGPDPVAEHDSHGQFIWLVWNYFRHTGDLETLRTQYPRMLRAAEHIQHLRSTRLAAEWQNPERLLEEPGKPPVPATAFAGLVPASISHEGYSAKPMHSYWDDAFCLLGLRCASRAARTLGDASAERVERWAGEMAASLDASVVAATGAHGITYMPGCVELGDFDATSTTVALWPCAIASPSLTPRIRETFNQNWEAFVAREHQDPPRWRDYTPYELRQVGAYVQLGEPDRALRVLDFHMRHRRPAGWNHWAEVVRPGERTPGFVGDMPHTWCGSDFLNSLRIMFAYERPDDQSVVLLGGIPRDWIATGEAISVADLGMPGGRLSVAVQRTGSTVRIRAAGSMETPAGGFRVRLPAGTEESTVTLNGQPVLAASGEVRLDSLPSTIDLAWDDRAGVDR